MAMENHTKFNSISHSFTRLVRHRAWEQQQLRGSAHALMFFCLLRALLAAEEFGLRPTLCRIDVIVGLHERLDSESILT